MTKQGRTPDPSLVERVEFSVRPPMRLASRPCLSATPTCWEGASPFADETAVLRRRLARRLRRFARNTRSSDQYDNAQRPRHCEVFLRDGGEMIRKNRKAGQPVRPFHTRCTENKVQQQHGQSIACRVPGQSPVLVTGPDGRALLPVGEGSINERDISEVV